MRIFRYLRNGVSCYYNRCKFSCVGIQLGKKSRLLGCIYIKVDRLKSKVIIGNNFILNGGGGRNAISRNICSAIRVEKNASLVIGDNVRISDTCIWSHDSIEIGDFVTIGGDTIINDSNCHSIDFNDRRHEILSPKGIIHRPIVIEEDVFIGARCIIGKGVTIGARSIIGAGSIVVSDIPKDVIAGGNPCKIIKYLKW